MLDKVRTITMDLGHKKYKHFRILSDHKWYS